MTDRELIEAAAKAAGIVINWPRDPSSYTLVDGMPPRRTDTWENWNPLTDDGDRYRLARVLGLSIDFSDCTVWKRLPDHSLIQEYWGGEYGDEAHAIVRAAAAMAKEKA